MIEPSDVVDNIQGITETWFGAMADANGGEYKVVHMSAPKDSAPNVMFLEFRDRDLQGMPTQRFIVEITARPIP